MPFWNREKSKRDDDEKPKHGDRPASLQEALDEGKRREQVEDEMGKIISAEELTKDPDFKLLRRVYEESDVRRILHELMDKWDHFSKSLNLESALGRTEESEISPVDTLREKLAKNPEMLKDEVNFEENMSSLFAEVVRDGYWVKMATPYVSEWVLFHIVPFENEDGEIDLEVRAKVRNLHNNQREFSFRFDSPDELNEFCLSMARAFAAKPSGRVPKDKIFEEWTKAVDKDSRYKRIYASEV